MYPSASLCRAQEAHHRDRAAETPLENVRVIAINAALAWGLEARSAERREARNSRSLAGRQAREARNERDRLFSENPDRGYECP